MHAIPLHVCAKLSLQHSVFLALTSNIFQTVGFLVSGKKKFFFGTFEKSINILSLQFLTFCGARESNLKSDKTMQSTFDLWS